MRIQHNAAVLNSHNNIMKTANKMQKTYEKLSSGYKINGAADDAAGISISEKMRGQINGLAMAKKTFKMASRPYKWRILGLRKLIILI